jgi:hypothetical protein
MYFSPAGTCATGGTCRTTSAAMGDPPMNTQRFGFNGTPFTYSIPMANGFYDVILSFAEASQTLPGRRVFTVTVQGETSGPIDLVKLTGGINFPYGQTWPGVPVRSGLLTIKFQPVLASNGQPIGNPVINAIQIQPSPPPPPGLVSFIDAVVPTGALDGVNTTFALPSAPTPPGSLALFLNGLYQTQNVDYILAGSTITMNRVPAAASALIASYRQGVPVLALKCAGQTGTNTVTNPDGTTTTLTSVCDGLYYVQLNIPGGPTTYVLGSVAPPGFVPDPVFWMNAYTR